MYHTGILNLRAAFSKAGLVSLQILILLARSSNAAPQETSILPPPADKDPFVGRWLANAEKSKPKLSRKEASYERRIDRSGDSVTISSTGGAGGPKSRGYQILCNGTFQLIRDSTLLSCSWLTPNRVEGETKFQTGKHLYWAREVSADGKQLTIWEYRNKTRGSARSFEVLDRIQ